MPRLALNRRSAQAGHLPGIVSFRTATRRRETQGAFNTVLSKSCAAKYQGILRIVKSD